MDRQTARLGEPTFLTTRPSGVRQGLNQVSQPWAPTSIDACRVDPRSPVRSVVMDELLKELITVNNLRHHQWLFTQEADVPVSLRMSRVSWNFGDDPV